MNKRGMNFKDWLYQLVAFLIAWSIVSSLMGLVDDFYGTLTRLYLTAWLCAGMAVMLMKNIKFPYPQVDRVDVIGAFKTLWWATFWPRYLIRK
ncbi:MAG TPA: hypothetical protein VIF82_06225 [Burkholderiaceae bacterium]|jgi:hypothetical protein